MAKSPTRKNLLNALAQKGITKGLTKLAKPNLKRLLTGKSPSPVRTPNNVTKLTREQLVRLAKQRGIKVTTKNKKQNIINKLTPNINSVLRNYIKTHGKQVSMKQVIQFIHSKPQFKNVEKQEIRNRVDKILFPSSASSLESVPVPSGSSSRSSSSSVRLKKSLPNKLSPLSPHYRYSSANMDVPIANIIKKTQNPNKTYAQLLIESNEEPSSSKIRWAEQIIQQKLNMARKPTSSELRKARAILKKPYNNIKKRANALLTKVNVLMAKTPTSSELRKAREILNSGSSAINSGINKILKKNPSLGNSGLMKRVRTSSSSGSGLSDVPLAKRVQVRSSSSGSGPLAKRVQVRSSSSVSPESLKKRQSLVKRLLEKYKREKKPQKPQKEKVVKQTKTSVDCIERSKIPLRDYQKNVCTALRKQRGLIAVHSVGSGKTLTAVTASQCFLQDNPGAKVIVVTPVSLIDNFKKEMEAYGISSKDKRYEYYSHAAFALRIQDGRFTSKDMDGNMLIIDEIHNYKKTPILEKLGPTGIQKLSRAQRAHLLRGLYMPGRGYYVRKIAKFAKKILGLTATPIVNTIDDLRFPISIITGRDLANRAGDPDEFGDKIGGLGTDKAKEEIISMSRGLFSFYERPKDDPRFPGYNIKNVYIEMDQKYLKVYNEIEQTVFTEELDYKSDATAFFTNIRNAVNKIDNTMDSPKVMWALKKITETVKTGGKVLLYSVWLDSGIKMIADHLRSLDIGYNFISGDISQTKRKDIVKDYNSGKKPVLLISKAGGEGLDLKGTTVAIMLEPVWNPATEMQVFGRAVRSGSHLGLPKNKQFVKCYLLFLVRPGEKILQNAQDAMDHKSIVQQPDGSAMFEHAADQIINGFVILKRRSIKEIYSEISKHGIEKKQFVPWSANRRFKRI